MATRAHEKPSTATVARVVFTVAGISLILYAIYRVRGVLVLVLIAAFLAVGLDPAVRRLERWGLRRGHGVGAIFLGLVIFLVGFSLAVIPPLARQVTLFASDLPGQVRELAEQNPQLHDVIIENDIPQKLQAAVSDIPSNIGGSFGSVLGIAGSVLAALFNVLTVIILTIYFMMSLARIRVGSLRLVPKSKRQRVAELTDPILEKIGGYIAGQITVALIAGSLAFVVLAVVGVPFPVALALWVAIASLIPLVGATLGAIPAVAVAFFDSVTVGIVILIYFIVYQQVENYLIAPRIMTRAVDISPAAVLLAALIGGSLLGFVGALMAIPAAASIKIIVQEVVIPRVEAS
jgi:predicted PurR-regulated permease PerM